MKQNHFQSVVWREGNHFVAQCLNVDISSFGASREEALRNLDEAISLYLDDAEEQEIEIQKVEEPEIVGITVKYA